MEDLSLVSVVIVTYNSASTIVETLDSIYEQTYKKIELVISDDCSTDSTLSICEEWIEGHKERFENVKLLKVEKNTGISANLNRAIRKAGGVWIKSLAGDDLLAPTCIDECLTFVKNEKAQICMVRLHLFDGDESFNRKTEKSLDYNMYRYLKSDKRKKQYKRALYEHILPGPGIFYSKELWENIGGFDEKYPNFEEYSFELKVLEKEKVFFLDKPLVRWRQREGSMSHSVKSPATWDDILFFKNVRRPLLIKHLQFLHFIDSSVFYFLKEKIEFNNASQLYKLLWLLSPLAYIRMVRSLKSYI